jgi:hypothetical protein
MIPALESVHTGRLVLTPADPLQAPDQALLAHALTDLGLIGSALPASETALNFRRGPAFSDLIGFTGCAVTFADGNECEDARGPHVCIAAPAASPVLLVGRNTRPPRCPACGHAQRSWRASLDRGPGLAQTAGAFDATTALACPGCGASDALAHWRWGRHGGVGRSFVSVEEVFPAEGAPLPALMMALAHIGAGPWRHFYVQD